eukprot:COSAG06_NODE_66702_length_253_cov_1.935065_1_plen_24_part_10
MPSLLTAVLSPRPSTAILPHEDWL